MTQKVKGLGLRPILMPHSIAWHFSCLRCQIYCCEEVLSCDRLIESLFVVQGRVYAQHTSKLTVCC
jgi:hypothetical protein